MGKRKLRFDFRKNYERKRHRLKCQLSLEQPQCKITCSQSAAICLHISLCTSLYRMLSLCNKIDGWNPTTVQGDKGIIAMSLSKKISTIDGDYSWNLAIGASIISLPYCQLFHGIKKTNDLNMADKLKCLVLHLYSPY